MNSAILVALLATLAASVSAQNRATSDQNVSGHSNVASHRPQKKAPTHRAKATRGEAASLETKEADMNAAAPDMRDDNRGRLTSAHPHSNLQAVNNTAPHHAATLKTGQLTTRQRSVLNTKETALHRPIHSDQTQDRKLTPDNASTTTTTIHLKKHNARMF